MHNTATLSKSERDFLSQHIAAVPDFPKAGILFRDITPLLSNPDAFRKAAAALSAAAPAHTTAIAGIESRGFIFATALAQTLSLPLIPLRKPNKLPRAVLSASYQLEYGEDAIEIHADALTPQSQVLLVDDLIATGGTLCAAAEVIEQTGATITQTACLIELTDLPGRQKYARPLHTILQY